MPSIAGRRYVIVGAGVAGLATAIALKWRGAIPVVLERSPKIRAIGAGIQLTPNAIWAARRLGIDAYLEGKGIKPESLIVRSGRTGRNLLTMPMGDALRDYHGAPSVVLHRRDLIDALVHTARALNIEIRTGLDVVDIATHARGATALAENNHGISEAQGALLIAADGVWSGIRRKIFNSQPASFAHYTAWRATVPSRRLPAVPRRSVGLWLGPDAHLVHYPISGGDEINIVGVMADSWRGSGWASEGDPAIPRLRFRDWAIGVRELIAATNDWTRWPVCVVDPVMPWTYEDSVLLIGDAAHASLPFAAQGAALALEDAVELATHLERHADNQPKALSAFVTARRKRAQTVLQQAEKNGASYHIPAPFSVARDLALMTLGGNRVLAMQKPIYGWRPSPVQAK